MKSVSSIFLVLSLLGCQATDSDTGETLVIVECHSNDTENLLQNPEFTIGAGTSMPEHWRMSQHAGVQAYTIQALNGELAIDKFAEQHWLLVTQAIKTESVAGESVIFTAEMQQNMTDDGWTQVLEPGGGLSIIIHGTEPEAPLRQKLLLNSSLQHEPKLGVFDWTPVSVDFVVPVGTTRLEVGFLHQANGDMAIRNPALRITGEHPSTCE